jgi:Transposase IS4
MLKNKPIPQGFKLYILCDHGYALRWLFYTPKAPTYDLPIYDDQVNLTSALYKLSNTEKAAFALIYALRKRCRVHVYLDNYFTSTPLALALREYHIGLTDVCKSSAIIATRMCESEAAKTYDSVEWYASN